MFTIKNRKDELLSVIFAGIFKKSRRSVSRVLSFNTVIYLLLPLPTSSSDVSRAAPTGYLTGHPYLAPDGVYTARDVSTAPVSSYLAFSSLQSVCFAVIFCCPLGGILPCGARTFLVRFLCRNRTTVSTIIYYITFSFVCLLFNTSVIATFSVYSISPDNSSPSDCSLPFDYSSSSFYYSSLSFDYSSSPARRASLSARVKASTIASISPSMNSSRL